jgi:hypothetical protein
MRSRCINTHFLNWALVGGERSASRPCRFILEERALGTHWIRGWVGPRAGLYAAEKRKILTLPGLELRTVGCPARSQSLYRLRYCYNLVEINLFPRLLCKNLKYINYNFACSFVWMWILVSDVEGRTYGRHLRTDCWRKYLDRRGTKW